MARTTKHPADVARLLAILRSWDRSWRKAADAVDRGESILSLPVAMPEGGMAAVPGRARRGGDDLRISAIGMRAAIGIVERWARRRTRAKRIGNRPAR